MAGDPVKLALAYVARLADIVKVCRTEICKKADEGEKCKPGAGIARRASDLPGLIASAGLIPAITFYMSKADRSLLNRFVKILESEDPKLDNDFCKDVAEELGWKEKAGYTVLLAVAVKGLIDMRHLGLPDEGSEDTMRILAKKLKELRGGKDKELLAEREMLELLAEVKKLAAALFKQQED